MNNVTVNGYSTCPVRVSPGHGTTLLPDCSELDVSKIVSGMTAGFFLDVFIASGVVAKVLDKCRDMLSNYFAKQCSVFSTSTLDVSRQQVLAISNDGPFPLTVVNNNVVFRIWDMSPSVFSNYEKKRDDYLAQFQAIAELALSVWPNFYIASIHFLKEERVVDDLLFGLCNQDNPLRVYLESFYRDKSMFNQQFLRYFTDDLKPNHACLGLEDIRTQASFEIASTYAMLHLNGANNPSVLEDCLQTFIQFLEFDAYLNNLWGSIHELKRFHKVKDLYEFIESIRSFKQNDVPDESTIKFVNNKVESQFLEKRHLFLKQAKMIFRYLLSKIKDRFDVESPEYAALDGFYKTFKNELNQSKKGQLLENFVNLFRGEITTAGWKYGPGIVKAGASHIPGFNTTETMRELGELSRLPDM